MGPVQYLYVSSKALLNVKSVTECCMGLDSACLA